MSRYRATLAASSTAALLLLCTVVSAQDYTTQCTLDNGGMACRGEDGLYGNCGEDGPNSCDGENPDRPGECRGYPSCGLDRDACDGKAAGDACGIAADFHDEDSLRVPGLCVTFAFDDAEPGDEFVTCDLSAAEQPDDEDAGCATAPGGSGGAALLLVAGLVVIRRRV